MNMQDKHVSGATEQALSFATGWGQTDTHAETLSVGRSNPAEAAGRPYLGITSQEIAAMLRNPPSREKAEAQWFIPSTYRGPDARRHAVQREQGEFWWLAVDIDQNNLALDDVLAALEAVAGDCTRIVYSSRSATPANRKWRLLVPLKSKLTGADYTDTQMAFFDLLEETSVGVLIPDRALARPAQLVYLPNRGEHYEQHHDKTRRLDLTPDHPILQRREDTRRKRAEAEAQAWKAWKSKQAPTDATNIIEAFNAAHPVANMLARHGYTRAGSSNDYRSPFQTSGSYATRDCGDHWISLSGSDADVGLGRDSKTGARFGDAFDLFAHFEHGGNHKAAVRAYAEEIGQDRNGKAKTGGQQHTRTTGDRDSAEEQAKDQGKEEHTDPLEWFRDIEPALGSNYLIKDVLAAGALSVVYGPSGSGKTFLALDMAFHIATGTPRQGRRVQPAAVLYLAAEGGRGVVNRIAALRMATGTRDVPLALRRAGLDLLTNKADLQHIRDLVASVRTRWPDMPIMIVIDTLSRIMAGGDENSAADMTALICNIDEIREHTGAHIMLVHHTGKAAERGARGHSSLRAATDTEIEVQDKDAARAAEVTKQRDFPGGETFAFTLKSIALGVDQDGDEVTSCVVEWQDAQEFKNAVKCTKGLGGNQKIIADSFDQMLAEGLGTPNPGGVGFPDPGHFLCVPTEDLRRIARGKMVATDTKSAFNQAMKVLTGRRGLFVTGGNLVWRIDRRTR